MARPQMDSRVEGQSPTWHSRRTDVLRRDGCPNGNAHSGPQPRHRHRTTVTQTSPMPLFPAPVQDVLSPSSAPQQDCPFRDNTAMEPEWPSTGAQQPLPDLLPEIHSSSADSSHRNSSAEEEPTLEEQAIHRVAIHLRTIGDEMNAVYLQRRNENPQWQNWRGLYHGLVVFLADTISTLYQHGLR